LPKLVLGDDGKPLRESVLGGRATLVKFERQPDVWVYRQIISGSKSYFHQKLVASDKQSALREAEELFLALQSKLDERGQQRLGTMPLEDVLKAFVKVKEQKQAAGLIGEDALRGCIAHLMGPIRLYLLKHKKLKTVNQIKKDTFLDYVNWRMTEGWKHLNVSGERKPPKESTVKRDLTHLKDWFQNYLIPRGFIDTIPTLEKIIIRQDQLDANPPIPLEPDWRLIHNHLRTWAKEGESHRNPRVAYWRELFRHFVLVSYNAGTRPKELVGRTEKQRQFNTDGSVTLKEVLKGGLRWDDVKVHRAMHKTEDGKEFEVNEATLHIRYTKTGVPRDVPCNTGDFFIRWRTYCDAWRKQNGFPPIKPTDYVFFNPNTGKPYPYSQFSNAWRDMREQLADRLTPIRSNQEYTLYSLRSSYITNQIEEGKDVYLVKQLTGHSLEILVRHYDRSNIKKRSAEATARTYAKKKQDDKTVDLQNLSSKEDSKTSLPRMKVVTVATKRSASSKAKVAK
jgi:hypothetical protein